MWPRSIRTAKRRPMQTAMWPLVSRHEIESHLAMAEGHIIETEYHLARQREIVVLAGRDRLPGRLRHDPLTTDRRPRAVGPVILIHRPVVVPDLAAMLAVPL